MLTEEGFGWHREMLEPLQSDGPGLSDVLLYRPVGADEPTSVLDAAGRMLPPKELVEMPEVGLYWEVYGAPASTPIEFEVQLERGSGGFVDALRRLLPGRDEATGALVWTEPSTGPVSPRAIVVGLGAVDSGSYTLILRAQWDGQPALETRRAIEVRDP